MSWRTTRPTGFSLISFPSFDLFLRKLQARSSFGAKTRPVIRPDRRGLDHRTTRPHGPVTPPHALFERSYGLLSRAMARLRPENHAVGKIAGPSMASLPPSSMVPGNPAGT